jgi:hypothetical protein
VSLNNKKRVGRDKGESYPAPKAIFEALKQFIDCLKVKYKI